MSHTPCPSPSACGAGGARGSEGGFCLKGKVNNSKPPLQSPRKILQINTMTFTPFSPFPYVSRFPTSLSIVLYTLWTYFMGAAKFSVSPPQQVVVGTLGWRRAPEDVVHQGITEPQRESAGGYGPSCSLGCFRAGVRRDLCPLFVTLKCSVQVFGNHPSSAAFPDHPVNCNHTLHLLYLLVQFSL